MKKNLILIGMFLFTLTAVNAQEKKDAVQQEKKDVNLVAPENKNQAEIKFDEEEFNFGTIKQGEAATHEFKFVNTGKEPLIISNAQGSCGCTVPEWPKEPIQKGAKGTIKVTFNSAGKMGMQDKTVTITSNAKSSPKVIHMKGNVEAGAPAQAPESDKK